VKSIAVTVELYCITAANDATKGIINFIFVANETSNRSGSGAKKLRPPGVDIGKYNTETKESLDPKF
jgi:hypothetical protein